MTWPEAESSFATAASLGLGLGLDLGQRALRVGGYVGTVLARVPTPLVCDKTRANHSDVNPLYIYDHVATVNTFGPQRTVSARPLD